MIKITRAGVAARTSKFCRHSGINTSLDMGTTSRIHVLENLHKCLNSALRVQIWMFNDALLEIFQILIMLHEVLWLAMWLNELFPKLKSKIWTEFSTVHLMNCAHALRCSVFCCDPYLTEFTHICQGYTDQRQCHDCCGIVESPVTLILFHITLLQIVMPMPQILSPLLVVNNQVKQWRGVEKRKSFCLLALNCKRMEQGASHNSVIAISSYRYMHTHKVNDRRVFVWY